MAYEHLSQFKEMITRCNTCCRCPRGPWDPNQPDTLPTPSKQCPTFEYHESLASAAQGMILICRDLMSGKLEPTPELVEHMYECLLCRGCNAVCEGMDSIPLGSIQGADIFKALRADLVEMGIAPPEKFKKFTDNIAEKHNRQGVDKSRSAWAEELQLPSRAPLLIFTSCTGAYGDSSSVQALARVLRKAGVDFGVLADEWCCGLLQLDGGCLEAFRATAEHNVAAIRASGAREVVVTCADCYKALKYDYPAYVGELGFEVIHSSELFARFLREGKLKLGALDLGGVATYNDPCYLARPANRENGVCERVTEEPREVLRAIAGVEWKEMEGFGKYTYCCGRPLTAPLQVDLYRQTGLARLGDALKIEAKTIVTGCANCKTSLKAAARKAGEDIRVLDLAELVEQAMV